MGEGSKIEWTHHTFNPWRGCTHVSPGCEHCYAEALSKRNPAQLGTWGAGGERVIASESYWKQPERWNRAAEKAGDRHRVFCASLADVFEDRPELIEPRWRLFSLIADTPHLDWLLLTKRPENARVLGVGNFWLDINAWRLEQGLSVIPGGMTDIARDGLPNVWLGTTVEDQRRADERIPILLDTPAAVRFLSCEPLLGPVDLGEYLTNYPRRTWGGKYLGNSGPVAKLDWIIVGGESGPKARPMELAWARSLVEQGRAAGVPVFVKQLGKRPVTTYEPTGCTDRYIVHHRAGGDPEEWPADLRVREFPEVR